MRALAIAAVGGLLFFCFHDPVLAYLQDHYYQSHFLFLWAFFIAALYKAGRGQIAASLTGGGRTRCGLGAGVLALAVLHAGLVTGSSTVQRLSLVLAFTSWALIAAKGWSVWRCGGYAAFAMLCFGLPYSVYFKLTNVFRATFMEMLEFLGSVLPLGYRAEGATLFVGNYPLAVTEDCSGFNQLVTFIGLAMLGTLTGRSGARRVALLFTLAIALAYLSNLARMFAFVGAAHLGWTSVIEEPTPHSLLGFFVYAPFVLAFIWVVLKTHKPLPPSERPSAEVSKAGEPGSARRAIPVAALVAPFVIVRLLHLGELPVDSTPPAFFADLQAPPGYELVERADSEDREREVYDTPWLMNAAFVGPAGESFEMFSYLTRSRRHLAVHQISNCLEAPGSRVAYGPVVEVQGRRFWSLEVISEGERQHGYFSFVVDGEDHDDKFGTQLEVFGQRLFGGVREVGLTRFLMPGPLVLPIPAADRAILSWRVSAD